MKTNIFMRVLSIAFALIAVCVFIVSCDEKEDPVVPTPPQEIVGQVVTDIAPTSGEYDGNGTSSDPVIVPVGQSLSLGISQKSSYTDTDGSVYTCEPKGSITIKAKADTVYVKDLASLRNVVLSDVKETTEGESPLTTKVQQTISVGGNDIDFDLAYEIYNHVNKSGTTIEMPYTKLNAPVLGNLSDNEVTSRSLASAIKIRPLNQSRSVVVTETKEFEVTVPCSINAEGIHVDGSQSQDIFVEVNFVGVVTEEIFYPDPVACVDYTVVGETQPFLATYKTPLALNIKQFASYTTYEGNVYESGEFCALVNVSLENENVKIASEDDLNFNVDVPEIAENTTAQSVNYKQSFKLCDEVVNFDISYVIPEAKEGYDMAYMKLSPARFIKIESKEKIADSPETYRVRAVFEIDLESEKATEKKTETLTIYAEFDAVIPIAELISVEYYPGYDWEEEHHNIILNFCLHLYRKRTYSNGEVEIDVIKSPRYFAGVAHSMMYYSGQRGVGPFISNTIDHDTDSFVTVDGEVVSIDITRLSDKVIDTDKVELHGEIGVSDPLRLYVETGIDTEVTAYVFWGREDFSMYEKECDIVGLPPITDNTLLVNCGGVPVENLENGWYCLVVEIYFNPRTDMTWYKSIADENKEYFLINNHQTISFPIFFVVVDGMRFQFDEWLPRDIENIQEFTCDGTEANLIHYKKATYLDRDFYVKNTTHFYKK